MDNKKESGKKENNSISPYRYLVNSMKDMVKTVLPTPEQTRASFDALTDSVGRLSDNVAKLYLNRNLSEEIGAIADEMSQTLKVYLGNSITASHDVFESMIELISDIQREQIKKFSEIDFTEIFLSMYKSSKDISLGNLKAAVDAAYRTVQKDEEVEFEEDVLSPEEVREAIDEQISNPKGFQQRTREWSEKKIAKYFIIWRLICFLYSNFFQPNFQQNVGMPVMTYIESNVKDLPQKGAEVVCRIKEGIEAVIIENTNYYYKVSFTDENGVVHEGYVAKRNLKLIQQDENETEPEASEVDNE